MAHPENEFHGDVKPETPKPVAAIAILAGSEWQVRLYGISVFSTKRQSTAETLASDINTAIRAKEKQNG